MKIVTVVGARPQFVKASAVSLALAEDPSVREVLVHTGQHYDPQLSDVFFEELGIPQPDHHLGVGSGGHGAQTGRMLERLEQTLSTERPDWVLVYGDTNSTLAGALAAAKLHMPVAHVEAGLRSFNRHMPEEVNRVVADHVSNLLFTPTEVATANLRREGIPDSAIRQVGDVMYDVAILFREKARRKSQVLDKNGVQAGKYILATFHRAENTDDSSRLRTIVAALEEAARNRPVLFPIHPRTRQAMGRAGLIDQASERVRIIEPLGYMDMVRAVEAAGLVVTDSGGLQKEAFFHETPCVTVRSETEWVELIGLGWNRLAPPTDCASIRTAIETAWGSRGIAGKRPYGDGRAAAAIIRALQKTESEGPSR